MSAAVVPELICKRCGAIDRPIVIPGPDTAHPLRANCPGCGRFIQWLTATGTTRSPAEKVARALAFQALALEKRQPTPKQLRALRLLGYDGVVANAAEAAAQIAALKAKQREGGQGL